MASSSLYIVGHHIVRIKKKKHFEKVNQSLHVFVSVRADRCCQNFVVKDFINCRNRKKKKSKSK